MWLCAWAEASLLPSHKHFLIQENPTGCGAQPATPPALLLSGLAALEPSGDGKARAADEEGADKEKDGTAAGGCVPGERWGQATRG